MAATGTLPALPMTRRPACPIAVDCGNDGISEYGTRVASVKESAKAPRPEPRTSPILGRKFVRERISCAALSASVNWSRIRSEIKQSSTAKAFSSDDLRHGGSSALPENLIDRRRKYDGR